MKCLVDEALPRSLAGALRDAGIQAEDARDVGLRAKPDAEVFAYAVSKHLVLITLDTDFADIRRFPPEGHFGIVVARFPDHVSRKTLVTGIAKALKTISDEDLTQTLVILRPGSLRLRRKR